MIEVPNNFYWQLFLPIIKLASILTGLGCLIIALVLWENTAIRVFWLYSLAIWTSFPLDCCFPWLSVRWATQCHPILKRREDHYLSLGFEHSVSNLKGKKTPMQRAKGDRCGLKPQLLPKSCVPAKLLRLCQTLCDPIDCNLQAALSTGFSRQEYWSGLPGRLPHLSHSSSQNVVALFSHFLLWLLNPFHIRCTDWLGNEDI